MKRRLLTDAEMVKPLPDCKVNQFQSWCFEHKRVFSKCQAQAQDRKTLDAVLEAVKAELNTYDGWQKFVDWSEVEHAVRARLPR